MWAFFCIIFLLFNSIEISRTSPFLLTEKYLQEFKDGLQDFHKTVEEYQQHQQQQQDEYHPEIYNETEALIDAEHYDFIIVGGGTSGTVLANRLSERPEWKILLLEAGDYETEFTKIPKFSQLNQFTKYNWNFTTIPQTTWCYGTNNKQCTIPYGKGIGGTTIINNMLYTRGNQYDYDLWADLNNTGWCFNDILPYYKKIEDAQHLINFDKAYHHQGGLFHIENPQYLTKLHEIILEAGKELHFNTNIDYNGGEQDGFGLVQMNTRYGKRQSTAEAYLKPIKTRKNLQIIPNSYVIEIMITPHTKHVQGVKYLHNNQLKIAKIDKEVIVSAGAVNTPKLLMLSGVGPKPDLEHLGIEVLQDLQVGQNLQDHLGYIGLDFYYNNTEANEEDRDEDHEILDYLKNGKGPLTSYGAEIVGYLQNALSKGKSSDIEILVTKRKITLDGLKLNPHNLRWEIIENLWLPLENHSIINFGVMLTHPKSIGTIKLHTRNPLDYPLIDLNQLSDPDHHDLDAMLDGIKKILQFADTETFQKHGLVVNKHHLDDCKDHEWGTDDYWRCTIKYLTISLSNLSGTARMGPIYDKQAIVNDKLQVYGVHGLRVIDTSVIPVTISGHLMAPTIMIGEKGADLIKQDWK